MVGVVGGSHGELHGRLYMMGMGEWGEQEAVILCQVFKRHHCLRMP